jgi:hypothetical protein
LKVLKRVPKELQTIWREEAKLIVEGKASEVTKVGNHRGLTIT